MLRCSGWGRLQLRLVPGAALRRRSDMLCAARPLLTASQDVPMIVRRLDHAGIDKLAACETRSDPCGPDPTSAASLSCSSC